MSLIIKLDLKFFAGRPAGGNRYQVNLLFGPNPQTGHPIIPPGSF